MVCSKRHKTSKRRVTGWKVWQLPLDREHLDWEDKLEELVRSEQNTARAWISYALLQAAE